MMLIGMVVGYLWGGAAGLFAGLAIGFAVGACSYLEVVAIHAVRYFVTGKTNQQLQAEAVKRELQDMIDTQLDAKVADEVRRAVRFETLDAGAGR